MERHGEQKIFGLRGSGAGQIQDRVQKEDQQGVQAAGGSCANSRPGPVQKPPPETHAHSQVAVERDCGHVGPGADARRKGCLKRTVKADNAERGGNLKL